MATSTHCSPSRSSLGCCQFDHSQDDVRHSTIRDDNYFVKEKLSFPKRPEVNLSFRNLHYFVNEWNLRKFSVTKKEILHGISGDFKAGELVAIMGPSGAGKSTLLNVLAGYTVSGVRGEILVNGKTRLPYSERWKSNSCYIQQSSIPRTKITVGEAMTIAAHLKIGCSISSAYKHLQVLELLEMLGLSHSYDTLCGKLSGGQKKRLDIALELLTNPSVLFLDEPTSGLDSSSCSQCIMLLKRLAEVEKRTIICTIHQPSALLLEMFDSLYVVASGHCVYKGTISSLLPHLASVGASCPSYHNPADFIIEVVSGEYDITLDKLILASEATQDSQKSISSNATQSETTANDKESPSPAGFLTQCYLLYKRQLLSFKRDYTLLLIRLLCHLLIGIIFGYLYMGSGYRASGVLANYVYIYGSLLLLAYTGKMAVTLSFPLEMQILTREHFNRWYRLASYYISMLLVEIPFQAACATVYLIVSYWLTGQPMDMNRAIMFVTVSISASFCAQAWGFFIGATTPIKIAVFIGPIIIVLLSVFGFCIRYIDTPHLFRWLFHFSYFRASFHSLMYAMYGFNRMELKCDDIYCHFKKPVKFLTEMDIEDVSIANNLILIIGIGVLMHLLTVSALWCKLNRR